MIKSKLMLSFLCLFVLQTNNCIAKLSRHNSEAKLQRILGHNKQSRDEWVRPQEQPSALWSTVTNPLFLMCAGPLITPIATKIASPVSDMIDYGIDGIQGAWINLTYTPEQREELKQKQLEADLELEEKYRKANMKIAVLLTDSQRGEKILLNEKEAALRAEAKNDRINEQAGIANDIKIAEDKHQELLEELETIKKLKQEHPHLQAQLQLKEDAIILKWANDK